MAKDLTELDAHEQPSEKLKGIWKGISKMDQKELLQSPYIDDTRRPLPDLGGFQKTGTIDYASISAAHAHIAESSSWALEGIQDVPIYTHAHVPGLLIFPGLLTPNMQRTLLDRMIHRDLSNPKHQTNLHLHYDLPYPTDEDGSPASFFSYPPDSDARFTPKDPSVHKPLSTKQVLDRRLHWLTLGGQYDWTNRVYPDEEPPKFPPDLARFLEELFPETVAEAAIVNFYTPGDTMMMHRDVSEQTDRGLISLSIGCDALFMITPDDLGKEGYREPEGEGRGRKPYLLLRIRSGDAIYMSGESRFAWHGVPKVLKGTCPDYLADWPAEEDGKYEEWRGWLKNKRINFNVRQMKD